MSFLTDSAGAWLKQKKDLERLQGAMGPLRAQDQDMMGQMQQNVQGGLLQHMGRQYMDRLGQRTGLSAFGLGSNQAYKPWESGLPPGPGMQKGLLNRVAPPLPPAGGAINVDPDAEGLKSKLMKMFMMGG